MSSAAAVVQGASGDIRAPSTQYNAPRCVELVKWTSDAVGCCLMQSCSAVPVMCQHLLLVVLEVGLAGSTSTPVRLALQVANQCD